MVKKPNGETISKGRAVSRQDDLYGEVAGAGLRAGVPLGALFCFVLVRFRQRARRLRVEREDLTAS